VVDGSIGLLGGLTGDGDDLDDLFGAEGGRRPGPGGIVEELLQEPAELLRGQVLFGAVEVGRRREPAIAPGANGQTGQAQVPGHSIDAGVVGQGQEDRGASDQALIGGLLALEALQQFALDGRKLKSRRFWSPHSSTRSVNTRVIRSEPIYSRDPPPFW
jgi:hypothetical protein